LHCDCNCEVGYACQSEAVPSGATVDVALIAECSQNMQQLTQTNNTPTKSSHEKTPKKKKKKLMEEMSE